MPVASLRSGVGEGAPENSEAGADKSSSSDPDAHADADAEANSSHAGGAGARRCEECGGRGVQVQMHEIGPGLFQQLRRRCPACDGEGELIAEGRRCQQCAGKKVISRSVSLEVPVERGMRDRQELHFRGHADECVRQPNPYSTNSSRLLALQVKPLLCSNVTVISPY